MLSPIDRFLNKITMYRLVLCYLSALVGIAAIFGAIGWLPYNPIAIVFTALFLIVLAWLVNGILAQIFKAHPNAESAYITALILALIITPGMPTNLPFVALLIWVVIFAMASKYVLAIGKQHVFNPAAIAVVITAFAMGQSASWWIGGTLPMMAFVIAGGFLVVRKLQRFDLVFSFLGGAIISDLVTHIGYHPLAVLQEAALRTPIFFFASIMITEPLTTPATRPWRIEYGALVGLLFSPAVHLAGIYSTPELALVVGNLFSYMVSPRRKQVLQLEKKTLIGDNIYNFSFATEDGAPMKFAPGQYLEWTLGHARPDHRGNRRYFTIASSPTERDVQLGVKFYEPSSSFKKAMLALKPGEATIVAGSLAGDFTMPENPAQKLAFIAGGIGITPFRSMVKYLIDKNERRDVVLLYSNRSAGEIAYREIFDEAERKIGMRTIYVNTGMDGRITPELIKEKIPDYRQRAFYVSGTRTMVTLFERILHHELGVPRMHIKIDFFPGFK
jgi:ferredoxin-NADP reductase/Na+-translocating ferredoxin:NAD+ oxidoreductase RnfD subunit